MSEHMRHRTSRNVCWLLAGTSFLMMASPALAQTTPVAPQGESDAGKVEEIVVTATRRHETAQSTPLSISAFSGEALAKAGITDANALARLVPNLYSAPGLGSGNVKYSIRGVTSQEYSLAASSPIATYLDDVYQAYTIGISSQLFDVQRIEVLRGPQGTLFGKNSTGGAINYFSQTPEKDEKAYLILSGSAGVMTEGSVEGMINMPLSSTLAMRFSFRVKARANYMEDTTRDRELGHYLNEAARLQFQWDPDADTTARLLMRVTYNNGDPSIYHGKYLPGACVSPGEAPYICPNGVLPPVPTDTLKAAASAGPLQEKYTTVGTALNIEHKFGDFDLTSITAYQYTDYIQKASDTGLPTDYFHSTTPGKAWQASQEIRLATPANKPISAVVGAFFMRDHIDNTNYIASTNAPPFYPYAIFYGGSLTTNTAAVFASATVRPTDSLRFIGGLRYSIENRKNNLYGPGYFGFTSLTDEQVEQLRTGALVLTPAFVTTQQEDRTWRKPTWDLTAQYDAARGVMLYARMAYGFKSGGYNQSASSPSAVAVVSPETIRSYEIGVKSDLADRTVRINGALFLYDFTNQQIFSNAGSTTLRLSNAGKSRIQGGEIEVTLAPTRNFSLGATFGYTDAKFKQYQSTLNGSPIDLSGNTLPYAPKVTTSVNGSYRIELRNNQSITFGTDWSYRSRIYFDPYNFSYTGDKPLLLGNLRIAFEIPDKGMTLALFAKNITDRNYNTFAFFVGNAFSSTVYGDRRTVGAEFGVKF